MTGIIAQAKHGVFLSILVLGVCLLSLHVGAQPLRPVDQPFFERIVRLLELDEDQATIARAMYDDWSARFEADTAFRERVMEHSATRFAPYLPEFHEYRRGREEADAAIEAEWKARVEGLFTDLESTLRDKEQLGRMARVRGAWARIQWSPNFAESPEGGVDLIDLVDSLQLTPAEREQVEGLITEFEPQFIEARRAAYLALVEYAPFSLQLSALYQEAILQNQARMAEELYEQNRARFEETGVDPREHTGPYDPARAAELEKESKRLYRRMQNIIHTPRSRLVELNRIWLARFAGVLSEENAATLKRLFLEQAYPAIYPDPASATRLFEAALAIPDLTDGQREQMTAARDAFEKSHAALSAEMAQALHVFRTGGRLIEDPDEGQGVRFDARQKAIDLGWEREKLNQRQIHIVRGVLTPEQARHLPEWDFDKKPPDRPWDADRGRRRPPPRPSDG